MKLLLKLQPIHYPIFSDNYSVVPLYVERTRCFKMSLWLNLLSAAVKVAVGAGPDVDLGN